MNAPVTEATAMISVSATPAAIAFNFEETRAWLESELEQYDVVVTADTLADCKKLATELNKLAAEISKRRREAVAEVSAPIKDFEGKAKSLEQMCKDGRQRLLDQVQVFEDETKAKAKAALEAARSAMWAEQEVAEEFRRAQIDDLVKLSTLTKTGKLSAVAKQELLIRVNADLKLQQQTQIRLHLLENDSYRAGLAAPLTRAHVETFLFASDEEYSQRLQTMIASELERQKVAEERSRKRFEEEQRRAEESQQRKADADRRRVEAEQQAQQQTAQPEPEPQPSAPQQYENEPAYQAEPAPAPASTAVAQKHAYGPLDNPAAAAIAKCTQAEAEAQAIQLSANAMTEAFGIWVPGELIAIAYGGAIFRKP
ncbi:hypothetical protein CFI10_11365 [Marinobacterium iners]|uniref:DUF1351 domain-containing protein n=1 Tax=Marinobacterium iners TaxID=48076 RepID=UPI001A90C41C|nr:DUF1351 domain-containing protein [Marinobacterium iners]QSR35587.1 hypothetical protein CFI10_11365 [Marinobacterium iners]